MQINRLICPAQGESVFFLSHRSVLAGPLSLGFSVVGLSHGILAVARDSAKIHGTESGVTRSSDQQRKVEAWLEKSLESCWIV
jgi:hypothetical protein